MHRHQLFKKKKKNLNRIRIEGVEAFLMNSSQLTNRMEVSTEDLCKFYLDRRFFVNDILLNDTSVISVVAAQLTLCGPIIY